ncbi:MAG: fibronectin type III domain-containing protein, partial [Anaerovoracaceae bacterium]
LPTSTLCVICFSFRRFDIFSLLFLTLYKPSSPRISKKTKSSVNVYWRNMNEISGYEISKSSSRYGTFVVDNKSKFTTRATLKVKKNRNYYYKIRAYSEVDDEIIYSPWSNTKKFKLK